MRRAEAQMLISQHHHEDPYMHFSWFQPPFNPFIALISISNVSFIAVFSTRSTYQRNILQLEICVYFLSSEKCDSGSRMWYAWVCVCELWQHPAVCENSSPGPSVFLLKPICEFTRLIHCDPRADLLLSPSHSPLRLCHSLKIFRASLSREAILFNPFGFH